MKELKCPQCHHVFQVDEDVFSSIAAQVRDRAFDDELARRTAELKARLLAEHKAEAARADSEIGRLRQQLDTMAEIARLKTRERLAEKDRELAVVRVELDKADTLRRMAVMEEKNRSQMALQAKDSELAGLKEQFALQLRQKQEMIDYYKDMKARLSTKMIGESLEVHCSNEFNRVRASLYPRAYFEKDNDATGGSKGDFIFRDFADDGTEYISIMFEMKNEGDDTATRHRNEDFLAKLDRDRRAKGCEYAVLVSLLEADSELYNSGIVDVSYRYPRMFVVRPQFFMPIIALLSQASRKSIAYLQQLEEARRQSVDVTNFEARLDAFREGFSRNYEQASKKFNTAIEEIDKTIQHLMKVKDALLSTGKNLRLANDKTQSLTIKKLTYGNPTMRAKFNEARNAAADSAKADDHSADD